MGPDIVIVLLPFAILGGVVYGIVRFATRRTNRH